MRRGLSVDLIELAGAKAVDLAKSLRADLVSGKQWLVMYDLLGGHSPKMETFLSFEGAVLCASSKSSAGNDVRIDVLKFILKVINGVSSQPYTAKELNDFQMAISRYSSVTVFPQAVSSQPFLLNDFFPVLQRKTGNFADPSTVFSLVTVKSGDTYDSRRSRWREISCKSLIDALRCLDDFCNGTSKLDTGETLLLVAEGNAWDGLDVHRWGGRTIFYQIGPTEPLSARIQMQIKQLIDPMEDYKVNRLMFCKYDREARRLTFYNGELKRAELSGGGKVDGIDYWSPRPLYFKTDRP